MNDKVEIEDLPGYKTVKEVARILKVSPKRVYALIEKGRLSAKKAGSSTIIPEEDIENFQRNISGRPRMNPPSWRIPPADNLIRATFIEVQMQPGRQEALAEKMQEIRKANEHLFPGTIARYVVADEEEPERVLIELVWRGAVAPSAEEVERDLEDFRRALADVLDWRTARYRNARVLMYT